MQRPHVHAIVLVLTQVLGCTIVADDPNARRLLGDDEDEHEDEGSSEGGSSGCGSESTGDSPLPDADCDPCAGQGGPGRYYIDRCGVLGGSVIGSGLSCQETLATCLLNETDPDAIAVHCEWNGIVIHRSSTSPELCDAEYGPADVCAPAPCSDPCEGRDDQLGFAVPYVDCINDGHYDKLDFPVGVAMTCAEARDLCTNAGDGIATQSFVCTWNDEVLLWREVNLGECAGLGPAPVACDDSEG
ncbi:MAG TPA: hypothetical protein VG755_15490 [Nannocystaceae bacterium]|nr:hypothetical protein [Nannocystaceae bacterium]